MTTYTIDISNPITLYFRTLSVNISSNYTLQIEDITENLPINIPLTLVDDFTPNYSSFEGDVSTIDEGTYKYELVEDADAIDSGLIYFKIEGGDTSQSLPTETKDNEYI